MSESHRRRIVETAPAPDDKHTAIRSFAEPTPDSYQRAIVAQTFLARDLLGDAERHVNNGQEPEPKIATRQLHEAIVYLRGALALLQDYELPQPTSAVAPTRALYRAIFSAEATVAHVALYKSYDVTDANELEAKQLDLYRGVWRRSARAAKQEAHRALADLVELFPGAYESEEA